LFKKEIIINIINCNNFIVLKVAIIEEKKETIKVLLKKEAKVEAIDSNNSILLY